MKETARTFMQSCKRPQGVLYQNDVACSQEQNLICAKTGDQAGLCTCDSNKYFDNDLNKCVDLKLASKSCQSSEECRKDLGLACLNGICKCKREDYYWNDTLACSMLFYYKSIIFFN